MLRSGVVSNEYFDKYRFEADPALLRDIAEALVPLVPDGTEVLAGPRARRRPDRHVLSQLTGIPALFVRKEAKTYGTCQLAEGGDDRRHAADRRRGRRDVGRPGDHVVRRPARPGRDRRARAAASSTASRAARRGLADIGVELHPLFTMTELKAAGDALT